MLASIYLRIVFNDRRKLSSLIKAFFLFNVISQTIHLPTYIQAVIKVNNIERNQDIDHSVRER